MGAVEEKGRKKTPKQTRAGASEQRELSPSSFVPGAAFVLTGKKKKKRVAALGGVEVGRLGGDREGGGGGGGG